MKQMFEPEEKYFLNRVVVNRCSGKKKEKIKFYWESVTPHYQVWLIIDFANNGRFFEMKLK